MIYSGLDWSEDSGGSRIVITIVHVEGDDLAILESELAAARRRLGRNPDYVFKHVGAKANVHHQFYRALVQVKSLQAHVYSYERSTWTLRHVRSRRGDACICDGIITLTMYCPDHLVANQTLYIDLPRRDLTVVDAHRTALRQTLKSVHRSSFGAIKPRPDDRLEGGIVQVADMIAGEVREYPALGGPFLPLLGSRIRMV